MKKLRMLPIWLLSLSLGLMHGAQNSVPDSMQDMARLKQDSNPARLEALKRMLQDRNIPFELQTFESRPSPHGRTKGTNLVVSFGNGSREITLGAHYDALELSSGGLVDGMVDNGAAAIILVGIAEALKGRALRHRVRIVFFDMEETGLLGSQAYVAAHKSDIDTAIILDIAGFGDSVGYGFGKAKGTTRIRKALLMACAEQVLACLDSPNYPASDDRSFQKENIPVISVGSYPRVAGIQMWLLLNGGENSGMVKGFVPPVFTVIHSPEDNISKIDPALVDLEYTLILNTVLKLDASE